MIKQEKKIKETKIGNLNNSIGKNEKSNSVYEN